MNTLIRLLTILFIFTLSSCNQQEKKEGPQSEEENVQSTANNQLVTLTKEQAKGAGIQLGQLQTKNISSKVSCNGLLEVSSNYISTVIPPVKGYVEELYFLPGDYVQKGDKIACLSHPEYLKIQEEYLSMKSQKEFYEKEFKRQGELAVEKAASLKKMQQAKTDYEKANARFLAIKKLLRLMHLDPDEITEGNLSSDIFLYAPISGYVTEMYLNKGKLANENNPVYEIMDMDHLLLKLNVYEKDISRVKKGQQIKFSLVKNPDKTFKTRIDEIGSKINQKNRTFPVYAKLNGIEDQLKHGLYVNADIHISSENDYVLPNEAIIRIDGETHVFIPHGDGYVPVPVEIGHQGDDYTVIKNFKNFMDQQVVVKGAYFLNGELSLK